MPQDDLTQYTTSNHDFYSLLGVTFETSESDIRRAYRKTALKYHPDKLGKDFDPEKFHLLQIANDVLSDPAAKAAYDNARNARLQKKRANELFEGKRRQMKEDLEARERGVKRGREDEEDAEVRLEREVRRLAEDGKRRRREMEEKMRGRDVGVPVVETSAPSKEPVSVPLPVVEETEDDVARLERRIREAEEAKAKRKAEKRAARKSGIYKPTPSSPKADDTTPARVKPTAADDGAVSTPLARPDLFKTLKTDEKLSASPKFSFSPLTPKAGSLNDFAAATMARLKAAEKQRLEEEIKRQDALAAAQ